MNYEEQLSHENERIELSLPINAAYVSAARLTASAISNRMGFNIEDIEDVKVAVSEACTFFINQGNKLGLAKFTIIFSVFGSSLDIQLTAKLMEGCMYKTEEKELGIAMIQALMHQFHIVSENQEICIHMVKEKK